MPGMRVHELAKEFGMTSQELLDRLRDMKIPAKSHASMLGEAYVDKIRKELSSDMGDTSKGTKKSSTSSRKSNKIDDEQRKKEEAERRAAMEKELAEREAARAARGSSSQGTRGAQAAAKKSETPAKSTASAKKAKTAKTAAKKTPPKKAPVSSSHEVLVSQIESERERLDREREEKQAREAAERTAAEVKKRRAVEEELRKRSTGATSRSASSHKTAQVEEKATAKASSESKKGYNKLLSQIESEQQRIADEQTPTKKTSKRASATVAIELPDQNELTASSRSRTSEDEEETPRSKRGSKKSSRSRRSNKIDQELYDEDIEEDRYAKMAVQAERLQRDKVLAEARAAVAAAAGVEGEGRRKKRKEKRKAEARERAEAEATLRGLDPTLVLDDSVAQVPQGVTVSEFAEIVGVQPNDVIKRLMLLGQPLTLTQSMSDDLIELIADDLERKVRIVSPEEEYAVVYNDSEEDLVLRPPVVTVMGHVDHGKTSLLDAIRDTGVVESEAGGITQRIGASVVEIDGRRITFIDTPGHEAFTAMRARGAQVTDIIVLVVAADDGVMPQTIEAINHAKAADVPIIVAVNKIDKSGANPERVRQDLVEHGVIPEEWGGSNMFVDVSAKKKEHIDDLLETIILQADVLELKANPDAEASGFVIEGNLDKGRGPVATVLVQRGTLHPGDTIVAGTSYGRVRALINPHGEHVDEAKPADPVEVLGLGSVPIAGDEFRVFADERVARKLAEQRALRERLAAQEKKSHMNLDDLFNRIEEGKQTDLNLIIKADVQGSIEALIEAFGKMDQSEVRINIVHSAVGGITETDVTLAAASDAIIIGFNVRPTGKSRTYAEREKVDIRLYRVIYQVIEDINDARVGLLEPSIVESDTGIAEVREVFKVPKIGSAAGCYVVEGEINREDNVRIVRDGTIVFDGEIASLRRFKEDVKSVRHGYECGIGFDGYKDIKVGDTIESYRTTVVERTE